MISFTACLKHCWESVLGDMSQVKNKARTLNFRKAELQFFVKFFKRTPWGAALRDKGAE